MIPAHDDSSLTDFLQLDDVEILHSHHHLDSRFLWSQAVV